MARGTVVETRDDRRELMQDAGVGTISFLSVVAGTLVAFGAFTVISIVTAAVLNMLGVETTTLTDGEWRQIGLGGAIVTGVVLFFAYLFGGYVTGRMARRAGAANGLMMFVFSLVVGGLVGLLVGFQADTAAINQELRDFGVPTASDEWTALFTIAGVAALAAMLIGSALGGWLGERWHSKVARRAYTVEEDRHVGRHYDDDEMRDDDTDVDLRDRQADGEEGELHTHADGNMHRHRAEEHSNR